MLKKISVILGIVIALGTIVSFCFAVNSIYAKQSYVKNLEQRLDYKIKQDRYNTLQERIWKLEDRYHNKEMPISVKEEIRKLREEKNILEKKLINSKNT